MYVCRKSVLGYNIGTMVPPSSLVPSLASFNSCRPGLCACSVFTSRLRFLALARVLRAALWHFSLQSSLSVFLAQPPVTRHHHCMPTTSSLFTTAITDWKTRTNKQQKVLLQYNILYAHTFRLITEISTSDWQISSNLWRLWTGSLSRAKPKYSPRGFIIIITLEVDNNLTPPQMADKLSICGGVCTAF